MELQPTSYEIWERKYQLRDRNDEPVDKCIDDNFKRVALALANVEKEGIREQWYEKFLWALRNGAIPAGRGQTAALEF